MNKINWLAVRSEAKILGSITAVVGLVAGAGLYGSADANLTSAILQVTTYFGDNIGVVIAAVVGIALLFWFLHMLFRSVGVRRPTRGVV